MTATLIPFDSTKDNESNYDIEVHPLVEQILSLCAHHRIPCVMAFQIRDEELVSNAFIPAGEVSGAIWAMHEVLHGDEVEKEPAKA